MALQHALLWARDQIGPLFRLPYRDGTNLPSVEQPGMFYVSERWANQYESENANADNVGLTFGVVGANNTTSSSASYSNYSEDSVGE